MFLRGTDGKDLHIRTLRVPPSMIVGAWSVAVVLWELLEYHYLQHRD